MSKSTYIYDNGLGCGCGCSKPTPGLGESPAEDQSSSTETKKDIIKTAKDYINDEVPFRYKAGVLTIGLGYCWWRSRCRRKR